MNMKVKSQHAVVGKLRYTTKRLTHWQAYQKTQKSVKNGKKLQVLSQ